MKTHSNLIHSWLLRNSVHIQYILSDSRFLSLKIFSNEIDFFRFLSISDLFSPIIAQVELVAENKKILLPSRSVYFYHQCCIIKEHAIAMLCQKFSLLINWQIFPYTHLNPAIKKAISVSQRIKWTNFNMISGATIEKQGHDERKYPKFFSYWTHILQTITLLNCLMHVYAKLDAFSICSFFLINDKVQYSLINKKATIPAKKQACYHWMS